MGNTPHYSPGVLLKSYSEWMSQPEIGGTFVTIQLLACLYPWWGGPEELKEGSSLREPNAVCGHLSCRLLLNLARLKLARLTPSGTGIINYNLIFFVSPKATFHIDCRLNIKFLRRLVSFLFLSFLPFF